jgi:hypothetical protein
MEASGRNSAPPTHPIDQSMSRAERLPGCRPTGRPADSIPRRAGATRQPIVAAVSSAAKSARPDGSPEEPPPSPEWSERPKLISENAATYLNHCSPLVRPRARSRPTKADLCLERYHIRVA